MKDNLIKNMDMLHNDIVKQVELICQKYYNRGYDDGKKEGHAVINNVPCKNGEPHIFRINRNGYAVCTKCYQEFRLLPDSEIRRLGIIFC